MGKLIRHPVGHKVTFRKPGTGEIVIGKILDEVWLREPEEFLPVAPPSNGWREGAPVIQLIEWPPSEGGVKEVRFTYYVREEGQDADSWHFGGQYALSLNVEDYRTIMEKLQAKAW